jgi:DNA-binding transcriptional MerR regulator
VERKKYTIDELSELTGFTRRTVRYYIQEGLLEPPAGRGRGGGYYESHLERLKLIKSLTEKGMGLATVMEYLAAGDIEVPELSREVWAKYEIVPGLEIDVRRDIEENVAKKIAEALKTVRAIFREAAGNDK